jgi:hypothetical protein
MVAQPIFCPNQYTTGTVAKSCPKICASSAIFRPLPKVNNQPIGETCQSGVNVMITILIDFLQFSAGKNNVMIKFLD